MDYSRCNITKNSNRLIAILGLVCRFAKVLEYNSQDYAAGLWPSNLAFSLYWHSDPLPLTCGPPSHRHKEYVAPSWSWASVSGYIRLLDPVVAKGYTDIGMELSVLCDEFQVVMEPVTSNNPFGQVSSGKISLSGFIVPDQTLMWVWNLRKHTLHGQALNMVLCFSFPQPTYLSRNFDDIKDYENRKRPWLGLPLLFKTTGIDLLPLTYWKHPNSPSSRFLRDFWSSVTHIVIAFAGLGIFAQLIWTSKKSRLHPKTYSPSCKGMTTLFDLRHSIIWQEEFHTDLVVLMFINLSTLIRRSTPSV
jgi:hypothetical protein